MIRQNVKNALKQCLQGVDGVRSVFTTRQKITPNQLTPCITIYLPDIKENALTTNVPLGKRRVEITALLEIVMIDVNNVPEVGDAALDDILDAIDVRLRTHFNLDGVAEGSAIKNLETHVASPQLVEGQNVFRVAVKKFDITVNLFGVGP